MQFSSTSSALENFFSVEKPVSISKHSFQQLVAQHCTVKGVAQVHWKSAGFSSLSSFFLHLEKKGLVELNSNKSQITGFNKPKTKGRSKKRKAQSPSQISTRSKSQKMKDTILILDEETEIAEIPPPPVSCPICSQIFQVSDEKVINSHIDECLNLHLLQEENNQQSSSLKVEENKPNVTIGSKFVGTK